MATHENDNAADVQATPSRAAFGFIFTTVLLDMLAFGIVAPVFPKLVVQFEGGDTASAAPIWGLFGTVWAAMQFLCAPILGAISDRYGRRRVILLSNLGLGLDYVLMALAPSLTWLFVGRTISGITSASFGTAGAYIADVTPPERRAARFGMLGAAFGIGFILGPALGGLLGGFHLRAPFWGAAVLGLLNTAYGIFVLPESLPVERRSSFAWRRANPVGSLILLRSHPELFGLATVGFLFMLAHDSLPVMFVLYADYRYGWTEQMVGGAMAAVGACSMVVQAGLVGRCVSWLGERSTLYLGLIAGIVSFTVYGTAPTGWLFTLGIPIGALIGLVTPALQSLMTRRVSGSEQGQFQGAYGSLMGVASMIAPLLFTKVFETGIRDSFGVHVPGAPYLLAAIFVAVGLVLSSRVTRVETIPIEQAATEGEAGG